MKNTQMTLKFISFCFLLLINTYSYALTYTVTNTDGSTPPITGSLYWALDQANTNPGLDNIEFNIPGTGLQVITLTSTDNLSITDPVIIDAFSQPGAIMGDVATCVPHTVMIAIDGNGNDNGFITTEFSAGEQVTIQGFYIYGFTEHGLEFQSTVTATIRGNVFAANNIGIHARSTTGSITVQNNYIGTALDGSSIDGIIGGNRIGIEQCFAGTLIITENVIGGNDCGIYFNNGGGSNPDVMIRDNYIGTDCSLTANIGNQNCGINIGFEAPECILIEQNTIVNTISGPGARHYGDNETNLDNFCLVQNTFYNNSAESISTVFSSNTPSPTIQSATVTGTGNDNLVVCLTTDDGAYIEIYIAEEGSGDSSGGEGRYFLATFTKTGNASECFNIDLNTLAANVPCPNSTMSITANQSPFDPSNCECRTSEFGTNVGVTGNCGAACTSPSSISATATEATCTDTTSNSDAALVLTAFTDGDRVNYAIGNTYTGDTDYINATNIGVLPFAIVNNLANPSGTQDYTIRIFNGDSTCFTDVVVSLNETICTSDCPPVFCLPVILTKK